MMEIDPHMFPPLQKNLLSKDPNCLTLDSARLRAIYKELLQRMEKWFELKVSDDDPNQFDVEVIKLKRLLDFQDMNELLVLIEFILDILMRCERQQELVERIVSISD